MQNKTTSPFPETSSKRWPTIKGGRMTDNSAQTDSAPRQPRRCKIREVSSRYMSPTASSIAAAASSRSASPTSRRATAGPNRLSNASSDTDGGGDRPLSAERRRPTAPNSPSETKREKENQLSAKLRGSAGLWPSANTAAATTTAGDLKERPKTEIRRPKENLHAPANGSFRRRRSADGVADVLSASLGNSGNGLSRSSSSRPHRKSSADATQRRRSLDLESRLMSAASANSGDEFFSTTSSDGGCSTLGETPPSAPAVPEEPTVEAKEEAVAPAAAMPKKTKKIIRGSYVPARFLQDTLSRLRRLSDGENAGGLTAQRRRAVAVPVTVVSSAAGMLRSKSSVAAVSRGAGSPLDGSPVKAESCPSPATASRMSSVISFGVEFFKRRSSSAATAAQEEVAHQLRVLQNRWLQWRFVNARAQSAQNAQAFVANSSLYNVWCKTTQLRASVAMKRIHLQKLRHRQKLMSVLKGHARHLELWRVMETEHLRCVAGAIDRLEAASLRVPLVAGAKAEVREVKQVLMYGMHLMQGIFASLNKFSQQAEMVGFILPALSKTVEKERTLLQDCFKTLSLVATLEEEERSLKAHLMQLHRYNDDDKQKYGVKSIFLNPNTNMT